MWHLYAPVKTNTFKTRILRSDEERAYDTYYAISMHNTVTVSCVLFIVIGRRPRFTEYFCKRTRTPVGFLDFFYKLLTVL